MGFKISWIAFKDITKEEILRAVGGVDTGNPDEANEAPFSGAQIPNGWFVLFSNDFEYASAARLGTLSEKSSLVACQLHEGVMVSAAYAYKRGQIQWSLVHDADKGIRHLDVSGVPPDQFEVVRARLSQTQDTNGGDQSEVDYIFDVPLETAEAVCGYKHDKTIFDWGEPQFTVIEMEKGKGWLGGLFGKR